MIKVPIFWVDCAQPNVADDSRTARIGKTPKRSNKRKVESLQCTPVALRKNAASLVAANAEVRYNRKGSVAALVISSPHYLQQSLDHVVPPESDCADGPTALDCLTSLELGHKRVEDAVSNGLSLIPVLFNPIPQYLATSCDREPRASNVIRNLVSAKRQQ
jgi:hypothetical protein